MHGESILDSIDREIAANQRVRTYGWISLGNWRFQAPGGTIHDLSAADLSELDLIERDGLFLD